MKVAWKIKAASSSCRIESRSAGQTEELGMKLAAVLPVPGVVLLRGDLGTGKTTLTRGLARGLGVKDPGDVNSPSFTLVNIYYGRCCVYHVDLYRVNGLRALDTVGIDEFLGRDGVTVVEWSERLKYPAGQALEIDIADLGGDRRLIAISSRRSVLMKLKKLLGCENSGLSRGDIHEKIQK
jgi:tRNA threonylcarbamoyladenosine biosynthesis protein TsaE